jgi:hypothetical protein
MMHSVRYRSQVDIYIPYIKYKYINIIIIQ